MRLTPNEIIQIKRYTEEVFGIKSRVYLFGSRADDAKKGGDIDLFIEPEQITNAFEQEIQFLTKLKFALGDQKIDVIIAKDSDRLIEQEARRTGVLL